MKYWFLFSFWILLAFGCDKIRDQNTANHILNQNYLPEQIFTIHTESDTIIYGIYGTAFHIQKGSFVCENGEVSSKEINLRLKEVIQSEDIVLAGLQTITTDDRILASNGMLQLLAEDKNGCRLMLKQGSTIRTVLPNAGMKKGLKLFQGTETNEGLKWMENGYLTNIEAVNQLATDQSLYEKYCTVCHSNNLRESATGPALGNIHLYRKRDWFRQFTRNSQKMISEGDSIALCLWQNWKPTAINTFHLPTIIGDPDDPSSPNAMRTPPEGEALSDEEIDLIYDYLANESILQKIDSTEITYVVDCGFDGVYNSKMTINFPDDTLTNKVANIFHLNKLGWANIDHFWNDPRTEEREFYVEVNMKIPNTIVGIVFPNANVFIETFWKENGQYSFAGAYGKKIVSFPIGEPAILIATAKKGENVFFGYRKIIYGGENLVRIKMKKHTTIEIEKTIRKIL